MTHSNTALAALSADLAQTVAAAGASVVYVDTNPRRDASGLAWSEHSIVTVDHLIEREEAIDILLADGTTAQAHLAGRDPSTDLALLHTDATLTPPKRADTQRLQVGHLVLALGRDEDGAPGATLGVISSLDGPWRTWRGGDVDRFIRPDLNVFPGFSGGPLVDAGGALIGLNTWGLSRRAALTLPVETLARVIAQLESGGRIKHGYIGLAMQAVRLPEALRRAHAAEQEGAAIVVDVATDGPAERAGIMIGDVLLALGTHRIGDSDDVAHALGSASVGTVQTLRLLRGGDVRDVAVTIGERPQ